MVILATGAAPRESTAAVLAALRRHGVRMLPHDDAVAPSRLRARLAKDQDAAASLAGARVAVVGGSHPGVLAAKHMEIARARAVDVYRRSSIRLADERDGWIKYDGTGLKGEARERMAAQQRLQGVGGSYGPGQLQCCRVYAAARSA